jgi:lipopolysaccharide/colanic/teichoic acid biosynthesis glycosyltransferase
MTSRNALPRWVEVPAASLGLLVLSPVLLVAAVAVKATSRGPVLFRQRRMGRGGRTFWLFKLRTMRVSGSGLHVTVRGDARVTSVGALLRHLKLDEVPELWNVILGDMALVGPRPEVPELVDPEASLWRKVLSVRPGITDPVTLRLRNEEELLADAGEGAERFYREVLQPFKLLGYLSYLEGRSWRSDVRVLLQSARGVLLPRSVAAPTRAEMLDRIHAWESQQRERARGGGLACVLDTFEDNQDRRR